MAVPQLTPDNADGLAASAIAIIGILAKVLIDIYNDRKREERIKSARNKAEQAIQQSNEDRENLESFKNSELNRKIEDALERRRSQIRDYDEFLFSRKQKQNEEREGGERDL